MDRTQRCCPGNEHINSSTIYVGNLPRQIRRENVEEFCAQYGQVVNVDLHCPEIGRVFAFVEYTDHAVAALAKKALTGQQINRHKLKIGYGYTRSTVRTNPASLQWSKTRSEISNSAEPQLDRDWKVPSKTLHIGNLRATVSYDALTMHFEKYGKIKITIKRPFGNVYAFMEFVDMNIAKTAKHEMNGSLIHGQPCIIGYSKTRPTKTVWVGGIGDWASTECLVEAFSKFGKVLEVSCHPGKTSASIEYDDIESACKAVEQMRNNNLGRKGVRISTDFADSILPQRPINVSAATAISSFDHEDDEINMGGPPNLSPNFPYKSAAPNSRKPQTFDPTEGIEEYERSFGGPPILSPNFPNRSDPTQDGEDHDINLRRQQKLNPTLKNKSTTSDAREPMTFYPTEEEFKNFVEYIKYMERCGAHLRGIAKVVPPKSYKPNNLNGDYSSLDNLSFPVRMQIANGKNGAYQFTHADIGQMTVKDFRELSETERYRTVDHTNLEELETYFWDNILKASALYCFDVNHSLMNKSAEGWNFHNLGDILQEVKNINKKATGIISPMSYYGMFLSVFCKHNEDSNLYSINYLHFGYPKSWYTTPQEFNGKLENVAAKHHPAEFTECSTFLRHKRTLLSPEILDAEGIPYYKVDQMPGEIIVTFPKAYHWGFNNGLNYAEAVNFAMERWIEIGMQSKVCQFHCGSEGYLDLDYRPLVKKYKPELYDKWIKGSYQYWEVDDETGKETRKTAPKPIFPEEYVIYWKEMKKLKMKEQQKNRPKKRRAKPAVKKQQPNNKRAKKSV